MNVLIYFGRTDEYERNTMVYCLILLLFLKWEKFRGTRKRKVLKRGRAETTIWVVFWQKNVKKIVCIIVVYLVPYYINVKAYIWFHYNNKLENRLSRSSSWITQYINYYIYVVWNAYHFGADGTLSTSHHRSRTKASSWSCWCCSLAWSCVDDR